MGLTARRVIAAATESTYNTDATPTAASNAVLVENLSPAPAEGARMVNQPVVRPSLAALPQLYAGALMALEFDCQIKGSGTVDQAPEWGVLMKGCGFAETISAGTSVAYAPASDSHDSLTIYWWQDGRVWKLTGARGNVQFIGSIENGYGKLRFRFVGHVSGPSDEALPSQTIDDTEAPVLNSIGLTIGGTTLEVASLSVDMANAVSTPEDLNASDGYGEILITGREANGSIDPKAPLVATHDLIGNWRSGTAEAINTGVIGSTAGNQWKLEMPVCRYREPSVESRQGVDVDAMTFGAHPDSGDDEVTLTFT